MIDRICAIFITVRNERLRKRAGERERDRERQRQREHTCTNVQSVRKWKMNLGGVGEGGKKKKKCMV